MIAGVRGRVLTKTGDRIVVATSGGVDHEIAVPLGVLETLPAVGAEVALKTVLVVREDGWALYGFDEDYERTLFQRLLGTTGVGPRLALAVVSTLGGARATRAIRDGDLAALCTVPGIGKKTAERIRLELKDRLRDIALPGAPTGESGPTEEAVQALMNLGYSAGDAERAVRAFVSESGTTSSVDLIRGALQLLTKAK